MYLCGRILKSVLQTVCQSLSDSSEVVRSAGLFALGQFSEHLQVSQNTSVGKAVFLFIFGFQAFKIWFFGVYTWNEVLACFILFVTQYAQFRPYLQQELCVKEWTEVIIRCCML